MEVIRVIKSKDYTTVCNRIYKNKNLSLKAKGLLSLILSLSTHWQLSVAGLSKICKEGKSSIASTINELISYGYIERKMLRDGNRISGYQYTVFENPYFVYPENQDTENQQQYNTLNNKVKNNKVSIEYSLRFKKPEISEIRDYCTERNNNINAETFFNYYESKGWMIGKKFKSKRITKKSQKMIKNITLNELEEKCIDLLSETYIALGQHNHEPETTMLLAKKLAKDLKRRYSRLSWECIEMAFDNGINKHDGFVNAHTWGKWLNEMKQIVIMALFNMRDENYHMITPELKEIIMNKQLLIENKHLFANNSKILKFIE